MRWIKHLAMAHADKAITAIQEELGAEAYGVYWNIVEDIASAMEAGKESPSAIHSEIKWASICYVSARKFRKIVGKMADLQLIYLRSTSDLPQISSGSTSKRLQIDVPNILKYKDEYSKKSGATRKESRTDTEGEQIQKETARVFDDQFAGFRTAAEGVGFAGSESDWARARCAWRVLDPDQRAAAQDGVLKRHLAGEYDNQQFIPLPQNYLQDKLWTRPVRNRTKANGKHPSQMTVSERLREAGY